MLIDIADLTNIFFSGGQSFRADKQIIADIHYLLESGMIRMKGSHFADRKNYGAQIDMIQKNRHHYLNFEGGETAHVALKILAHEFLVKSGHPLTDICVEKEHLGLRPDVMTSDGKLIIECGNTEPTKIFTYFQNPELQCLVIIPYPAPEDQVINQYIFEPGENLSEFLLFVEKEKMKQAPFKKR